MNIFLKCSLLNGIDIVNQSDCDGVEVQLLNRNNNFSILKSIKKPIITLHVDLNKIPDAIQSEIALDLKHWLLNEFEYFKQICDEAMQYHSAIVIHGFLDYRKDLTSDDEFKNRIKEIDSLYPELKIYIENSGCIPYTERADNYCRSEDIPEIVEYLNKYSDHKIFYPLLDICHYYMEYSSEVYVSPKPISDIIKAYKSDCQLIHFNYGVGDCLGKRHSLGFETNKPLLKNLLYAINDINENAGLILEVIEKDYTGRPKMMELYGNIKEIIKEFPYKKNNILTPM